MSGLAKSINGNEDQGSPNSKSAGDLKILLAEDNKVNQKLAALLFKKAGIFPTIVSNGREAVDEALETCYDLIFMDVYMPEMDGLEATRLLKEKLGADCPQIIALTASTFNGDRDKIMDSGMDDFIAKPMSFNMLSDCINKYTGVN